MPDDKPTAELLEHTTRIVAAHVANNPIAAAELPSVIATEPHRVCRRLQLLRDWSYDKADLSEIFIGSARACRTDGA